MPLYASQFGYFYEGWGTTYTSACATGSQSQWIWVVPVETDSSSGTYDYSGYVAAGSGGQTCMRSEAKNPNGTYYSASAFVCNTSTTMSLRNGNRVGKPTDGSLRVAVYLGARLSNCSGSPGAVGSVKFWRV